LEEKNMKALISVSDKTGVVEFAKDLISLGYEIVSTGGTFGALKDAGVEVTSVSDITGFPECLSGRVKTLHPAVHGGILAMRDNAEHMEQIEKLGIGTIDVVAINLYPFKETIMREDVTLPMAIENIDIGGPTMLRSAAKNHKDVVVVCDPSDYEGVIAEIREKTIVSYDTKYRLALKVFEHTAAYDAMISEYLRAVKGYPLPDNPTFTYEKIQELRYGENPHQKAAYYKEVRPHKSALTNAGQLHGKELSFNNINDTNGALACLREFSEPTVVAVKHANPCGVGSAGTIAEAYIKAFEADPVSIFGGIIAANRIVDAGMAEEVSKIFVEIVIAPGFTDEALEVLTKKQNIRLLKLENIEGDLCQCNCGCSDAIRNQIDIKKVDGGILIQDADTELYDDGQLRVMTKKAPGEKELEDLKFAMKVVKHVKSNAIVIAKDGMTLGVGPGQTNRISAARLALAGPDLESGPRSASGAVLASDAFFPFEDCVIAAAAAGITAIIQPGGSMNDEDSIKKCDELGLSMIFTGTRHFKH
jgi:phosphoribosylaminoimidazolecarboxamide formyltransferase/IMP cyclohydrolase